MGRKPFVAPEVLAHESLTGLTLQSPTFIDNDGDGFFRGLDDPNDFDKCNPNPTLPGCPGAR